MEKVNPPAVLMMERDIPEPPKVLTARNLALWTSELLNHAAAERDDKQALRQWVGE